MSAYKYNPIVISGPSGSGKTELIDYISSNNKIFEEAIGMTTRSRRPNESAMMNFVTYDEFISKINEDNLIEYTLYNGNYYGVSKDELNKLNNRRVIFNVSYSSAKIIKKIDNRTILIYLLPPNKEELLRRLGNRGMERFILGMEETIKNAFDYEYLLISLTDNLPDTYCDFLDIVDKKRDYMQKKLILSKNRDFVNKFYK